MQVRKRQPEADVELRLQFIIIIGLKHIKYLTQSTENSKIVEEFRTMEAKIVAIKSMSSSINYKKHIKMNKWIERQVKNGFYCKLFNWCFLTWLICQFQPSI